MKLNCLNSCLNFEIYTGKVAGGSEKGLTKIFFQHLVVFQLHTGKILVTSVNTFHVLIAFGYNFWFRNCICCSTVNHRLFSAMKRRESLNTQFIFPMLKDYLNKDTLLDHTQGQSKTQEGTSTIFSFSRHKFLSFSKSWKNLTVELKLSKNK